MNVPNYVNCCCLWFCFLSFEIIFTNRAKTKLVGASVPLYLDCTFLHLIVHNKLEDCLQISASDDDDYFLQ
jgi:hypothetical protein